MGGLRTNVDVGLRYLASWLSGTGAAAIHDLMEDAATAEISRAQVWQWVHHHICFDVETDQGSQHRCVTPELVREVLDEIQAELEAESSFPAETLKQAREVFEQVALDDDFVPFLTLPAYELLP
jgi:malate synthase